MQRARLQLEANTTSEISKRSVSDVALGTDHLLPVKWRRRRSTLTSASTEDVHKRRLTFAFESQNDPRLDLALAAGVYSSARKRKSGSYVASARPVHLLHRVRLSVRRLSSAEENVPLLQSHHASQLLRLLRHRHHQSLLYDHLSFKKSFITIAILITALSLHVNPLLHLHRLRRQVRPRKTTWKLKSIVPAHVTASTSTRISSSSKTDESVHVASDPPSVNDLEALQHVDLDLPHLFHLLGVHTTTM
jgi:hypothetical protein